jgi:hypothetical protein
MADVVPTWNGISGRTISSTLRELANFLIAKNIGPNITETMKSWLADDGFIDQLWQATTNKLDELLNTEGLQGYWPGRLTPTLIELKELLEFLAYRDTIEDSHSTVKDILRDLMAFRAFEGSCHAAVTQHHRDTYAFINATRHHPSEVYFYRPTGRDVWGDRKVQNLMIYHWSQNAWRFDNDEERYIFIMPISGQRDKPQRLSYEHERLEAMLSSIGINPGDYSVLSYYGDTYGEDAVKVSLAPAGKIVFDIQQNRFLS